MKNIFTPYTRIKNMNHSEENETIKTEKDLISVNHLLKDIKYFSKILFSYIDLQNIKLNNFLFMKNNELYRMKDLLPTSYILMWLRRLIYSEENFLVLFNVQNITSIITFEIYQNIKTNISSLYRGILFLTIPVVLYRIQTNILIKTDKNSLEYIICNTRYDYKKNNRIKLRTKPNTLIDRKKIHTITLIKPSDTPKVVKITSKSQNKTELDLSIDLEQRRGIYNNQKKNFCVDTNWDHNRILEIFENKNFLRNNKQNNRNKLRKNEWNCIEYLFNDVSKLDNKFSLNKKKKTLVFNSIKNKSKWKKNIPNNIVKSYIGLVKKNLLFSNLSVVKHNKDIKNKQEKDISISLKTQFNWLLNSKFIKEIKEKVHNSRSYVKEKNITKKLSFYNQSDNKNKKYTQDILILLDKNRKKWRWQVNESINIYNKNNILIFNKKDNDAIIQDIEQTINFYWDYYKQYIVIPIIETLKIINRRTNQQIYDDITNTLKNKTVDEKCLTYPKMNKNVHKHITYNLLNNSINPHNKISNIIEKIHFFSEKNKINPLLYKLTGNNNTSMYISYLNEIEYIISLNKQQKCQNLNSEIRKILSRIIEIIESLNRISVISKSTDIGKNIKILYDNIKLKNDKLFFKHKAYLLGCNNLHIRTKYINRLNFNNKDKFQLKKYQNTKSNLNILTKIYESINETIFWIPPTVFDKCKNNQSPNSYKNTQEYPIMISSYKNDYDRKLIENLETNSKLDIKSKNNFFKIDQFILLKKYKNWIFTSEWWLLGNKIILQKISQIKQTIFENQKLTFDPVIQNMFPNAKQNLILLKNLVVLDYGEYIEKELKTSNKILLEEIYKSSKKNISIWDANHINTIKIVNQWTYLAWFCTLCILYYHWIAIFTGTPYIFLWCQFEKMRSLANPSSNTIVNMLVLNSIESPSQQLQFTIYSSTEWIVWLKSQIMLICLKNKILSNLFFKTNCVDVPRKKKNLVINYLITQKKLLSQYKLWNVKQLIFLKNNNILNSIKYEGLNYLQKWSRMSFRYPNGITYKNKFSKNFQWLQELYFCGDSKESYYTQKIPRNLPERIVEKKRWLLVGTLETGKSLLVKNIASNTHFPVVHISLKDIRHATPDNKYNKIKDSNKWVQQLSDRAFLLESALELAKMLSPCIFWISDLHEFHATSNIEKKEKKIDDTSFLFFMLLKMMTNDLLPLCESKITFIGSTDSPSLLDPKFVSRHRLDFIVNLRKYYFHQRQHFLINILQTNNFNIKGTRSFGELGSNTVGYSVRDLAGFANEILLIKKQKPNQILDTDVIRLALYRQSSKQSTNNTTLEHQIRRYKIGKAIIQSTLLHSKPMLPFRLRHDLWKNRFYYLNNVFLEKSINKSTITESMVFVHLINYLSGSAARDASMFPQNTLNKDNINISKQLEHDFTIASNILQSLLLEFPLREIYSSNKQKNKLYVYNSRETYNMNIMQKTIYSLNLFNRFASYTYWSYRIERLSLSWSFLFNNIKKLNKPTISKSYFDHSQQSMSTIRKREAIHIYGPYEKKRIREQHKNIQKIHSFFNEIMFEYNMKSIDFPWISEYVLDYNALQLPILLLDTKPLWDPPALKPSYSVLFFDRNLIINRDVLTKFYITYGEKFQNQKLNPKRIKEQFFWSKTTQENSHLQDNFSHKEDRIELTLENFDSFKQMAKAKSYFQSSQIEGRFYLYQSWNDPDYEENFRYSDLLSQRKNFENHFLQYRELLIYGTLLEIYSRLFRFFLQRKSLLREIENTLIERTVLNREYIENSLKNIQFL